MKSNEKPYPVALSHFYPFLPSVYLMLLSSWAGFSFSVRLVTITKCKWRGDHPGTFLLPPQISQQLLLGCRKALLSSLLWVLTTENLAGHIPVLQAQGFCRWNRHLWGCSWCFWGSGGFECPEQFDFGLDSELGEEWFYYSVVLGTAVRGGRRRKCLGLVILVLIKSLLERFPNKRTSLVLAGRAGLALHFMLRQCKIESLPNDWLIKE